MRDGIREVRQTLSDVSGWRINQVGTLAAGIGQSTAFQMEIGEVMILKAMQLSVPAPAGAASGDHGYSFRIVSTTLGEFHLAELTVNFDQPYSFQGLYCHSPVALIVERPLGHNAQISLFKDFIFDRNNHLLIRYMNRTNVAQTADRLQTIFYLKESIS